MTSRHRLGLAALTLITAPALAASVAAQAVESAPSNCCLEIYWVGWELGQLRSIADYPPSDFRRKADLHMQRLSTTLKAANQTCCQFCEAWANWPQIQSEIQATVTDLLGSSQGHTAKKRRSLHRWTETQAVDLLAGLNRCDLEEGMPCKWLGLVECARGYFKLGTHLGHAAHALAAGDQGAEGDFVQTGNARQKGLESLGAAGDLMAALSADGRAPGSSEPALRCNYLWEAETGAAGLLSEVLREPGLYTDAQLAARASKAHRLVLRLFVDGRPDLGIAPCPIGSEHDHSECELAEEHGHRMSADPRD